MFSQFLAAKLCVIPLKGGVPQTEWSKFFDKLPDEVQAGEWRNHTPAYKEYALVCGKVSNVIAIDIDTDETDRIEELAGISPVKKRGSKGFTAFYRYNGESSQNWKDSSGAVICELLSDKRLTTIPPSPHRKTNKPYIWMDNNTGLMGVELPLLSDDFIILMDAKYPRPKPFNYQYPRIDYNDVELHEAEKMLSFVDSNCARDEWVQIGMALRDEFGDAACYLWHSWSSKSTKYKHNDAQSAWRSFGGNGVTIATLVYFAKRGGYEREILSTPKTGTKEKLSQPKKEQKKIGGIVGAVSDWITSTAIVPQPTLSLAAAIAFVGLLKGHRVKNVVRGSRTNALVLSLAPTGGGKEHPQLAIDRLAVVCGLGGNMMGRPTSGAALLTGIQKAGGIALLAVDEMGRYMGNMNGAKSDGFQREIADYMVELFSCSNRTFRGRQYANEKERPQVVFEQPHFCCIGSTVPERFKASCTSAEVIDGFLNRWLVFSTSDRPEKRLEKFDYNPPEKLVDMIKTWMAQNPIEIDSYGVMNPKEISFTPEAWQVFANYEKKMRKLVEETPYPLNELYVRSGEHAVKLATIIADDDWIGTPEVEQAISIVEQSNNNILEFASGITNSKHEESVVYVLDVIKRFDGEMTLNQITQRTRRLNNKDRMDILNQLVESGELIASKEGKKTTFRVE
jgi:hypothetical protein